MFYKSQDIDGECEWCYLLYIATTLGRRKHGKQAVPITRLIPAYCKRAVESSNIYLYEKVSSRRGPWLIVPEAASTY